MTPPSTSPGRSTPGAESSEDLIQLRRVAAGDRDAFEQLYRAYHPRVMRFLYRLTRSPELAEEVFNDVMFVVWRKSAGFKGRSKVSTWVLGIAYRKGLKAAARARRRRGRRSLSELDLATLREPGSLADRRELRDYVGKALDTLPEAQRTVLELAYYLGHSCSEIADIVGCPENTVKTRMFHARKRLRAILPHLGSAPAGAARNESSEKESSR